MQNNVETPLSSQKQKTDIFVSDPLVKAKNERKSFDEFKQQIQTNRHVATEEAVDQRKGSFPSNNVRVGNIVYSGARERRNSEETLDEGGVVFNDVRESNVNEEEEDEVEVDELAGGTAAAAAAKGSMKEETEGEAEQLIWKTKTAKENTNRDHEEVVHLVKGGYDSEEVQDVQIRVKRTSKKEMMSQNAIQIVKQDSKAREHFVEEDSRPKIEKSEVTESNMRGEPEESAVEGPATETGRQSEEL